MEVCTTLGMLTPEQAAQLRTAGLTAYNHNLDTSPEYYPKVTSSRKYQVRLVVSFSWVVSVVICWYLVNCMLRLACLLVCVGFVFDCVCF